MFTICAQQNRIGRRICLDKAFLFVNFLPRALLNEAILSSPPLTPHASAFSTVKPCVFCLSCHFALSLPTTTVQLRIRGIYIHGENYTRVNSRSHVCIESRKGLTRMEDFSMGSVIDMFVDTWTLGKVCDRRIVWVTGIRLTVGWKVCEHPHAPQVFRP